MNRRPQRDVNEVSRSLNNCTLQPRFSFSVEELLSSPEFVPPPITERAVLEVEVYHGVRGNSYFVWPTKSERDRELFLSKFNLALTFMDRYLNSWSSTRSGIVPTPGAIYACQVKNENGCQWARVKVLSVDSSSYKASVFGLDSGMTSEVPFSLFRPLPVDFLSTKNLCVEVMFVSNYVQPLKPRDRLSLEFLGVDSSSLKWRVGLGKSESKLTTPPPQIRCDNFPPKKSTLDASNASNENFRNRSQIQSSHRKSQQQEGVKNHFPRGSKQNEEPGAQDIAKRNGATEVSRNVGNGNGENAGIAQRRISGYRGIGGRITGSQRDDGPVTTNGNPPEKLMEKLITMGGKVDNPVVKAEEETPRQRGSRGRGGRRTGSQRDDGPLTTNGNPPESSMAKLKPKADDPAVKAEEETPKQVRFTNTVLPPNQVSRVLVVYNGDEGIFVVNEPDRPKLEALHRRIQEVSGGSPKTFASVGKTCVAPFDGAWYRARVVRVDPPNFKCRVVFFDYGNEADVDFTDVREFPDDVTKDVFTIRVVLEDFEGPPPAEFSWMKVFPVLKRNDGAIIVQVMEDD